MSWWSDRFESLAPIASILTFPLGPLLAAGSFADPVWLGIKASHGIDWKPGEFFGTPPILAVNGDRNYDFKQSDPPFGFRRHTGEVIIPKAMVTDGGSIPRIAWSIPGLDPWTYLWAYLIHDWDWMWHHAGGGRSFEDTNNTLAEGVLTLMLNGVGRQDWRVLMAIYLGVSSPIGKKIWDTPWLSETITKALPEGI